MVKKFVLIISLILISNLSYAKEDKYKALYTEYKKLTQQYSKLLKDYEKLSKKHKTTLDKLKQLVNEQSNTIEKLEKSNSNIKKLVGEVSTLQKLLKLCQSTKKQEKPRFYIKYFAGYEGQFKTGLTLKLRVYSVWKLDFNIKLGGHYLGTDKVFGYSAYGEISLGL